MAEPSLQSTDGAPDVETKTEEVPKVVEEPTSSVAVESKVEGTEPEETPKGEEPAAIEPEPAAAEPAIVADEPPAAPAEESKEVAVESKDLPVETKEEIPAETKAAEVPAAKSETHPSFFQKWKGKLENKIKSKESPAKDAPAKEAPVKEEPASEVVAPAEPAAPVEDAPPPAVTTESKPVTAESKPATDKISEGKGFFNKVKKSFFTKSHSFSGSIADSKLGAAPAAPAPPVIEEVPKEAENLEVSTPPTETPAAASITEATPEPAAETVTPPAAETVTPPATETATPPAAETVTPQTEEQKEAPKDVEQEKAVVKEEKPKNNFFQKLVRRIQGKSHSSSAPPAAPPSAPVVTASA